jgi:hypothetical protein
MTLPKPTGTALYYPNIRLDQNCLKVTLLYWDRVRRIVPSEAHGGIKDNSAIKMAIDRGLLINTPPDDYRDAASQRFRDQFLPLIDKRHGKVPDWAKKVRKQLREAQKFQRIHSSKMSMETARKLARYQLSYAQHPKLVRSIADELEDKGGASDAGEWLRVPEILAGLYMVCLGAEMSTKIGSPLITDEPAFAAGGEYALHGAAPNPEASDAKQDLMLRLGLRFPRPEALATISMKEVIKFHRKSTAERKRLREAVESIATQVSKLEDSNSIADFFNDKRQEVQTAITSHRRRLDELRVATGVAALKLSIPSMINYAAYTVGLKILDPTVLGVTGIALSGVAWWADYRGKRDQLIASLPWHYALKVGRKFS